MRLASADRLVVATHNVGKLAEIRALLAPRGIEILSAADLGLTEPEETEDTFEGNARLKAKAAVAATGLVALADDSGLCVDALNGAPGVWSADWAETGNGRDFGVAMRRVRTALAQHPEPWTARFLTTLVVAWPDGDERVFTGAVHGRVVWPLRGNGGHGFDPIFQPDRLDRTVAELSEREKNDISHRGHALRAMIAACFT